MKFRRSLLLTVLGLIVALVTIRQAKAQSTVSADVDRTNLSTDESLVLTISVESSAGNNVDIELPSLDGFEILGTYQGTQVTIVNGSMTVQETYNYQLHPTTVGTLVIEPLAVIVGGNTFYTQPIEIIVTQGTGNSQPSNPAFPSLPTFPSLPSLPSFPSFPSLPSVPSTPAQPLDPSEVPDELDNQEYFLEAGADKPDPYLGEQVIYAVRFYRSVALVGQANYQLPGFTGFWTQDYPEQTEYAFSKNGRNFQMVELKTILFPTVIGEVTIDPATFTIPGGFFGPDQTLRSEPTTLVVKALPPGAPASFNGAVGHFSISATVDNQESRVNDAISWKLAIKGNGNVENLTEPDWPELPEWRSFDSEASTKTEISDDDFGGERTFERLLIPKTSGTLVLPSIEFSYFDPDLEEYLVLSSEPIEIKVGPEAGEVASQGTGAQDKAATEAGVDQPVSSFGSSADLRPIKPPVDTWSVGFSRLTDKTGYWLLWFVPLIFLGAHLGWRWSINRRQETAQSRRSKEALREARKSLRALQNEDQDAYATTNRILSEYLSARFNRSVTGMTQERLSELLLVNGIGPELVNKIERFLILNESGRYSPSEYDIDRQKLIEELAELIEDIDKEYQRKLLEGASL